MSIRQYFMVDKLMGFSGFTVMKSNVSSSGYFILFTSSFWFIFLFSFWECYVIVWDDEQWKTWKKSCWENWGVTNHCDMYIWKLVSWTGEILSYRKVGGGEWKWRIEELRGWSENYILILLACPFHSPQNCNISLNLVHCHLHIKFNSLCFSRSWFEYNNKKNTCLINQ